MRLCPVLIDPVCYMTSYDNKDEEHVIWKYMRYLHLRLLSFDTRTTPDRSGASSQGGCGGKCLHFWAGGFFLTKGECVKVKK